MYLGSFNRCRIHMDRTTFKEDQSETVNTERGNVYCVVFCPGEQINHRISTRIQKPRKHGTREHLSVREKSGKFAQAGKVRKM